MPIWFESRRVILFPQTYKKSYAIVAAVGHYPEAARKKYGDLEFMVPQARELKSLLITLGFPAENIVELYDSDASSTRIEQELRRFWPGGDRADADRLMFYFGGHGDHYEIADYLSQIKDRKSTPGLLVTSDHDPSRPLTTSFLLDDIRQRHFAFIQPRHALFLIDACSSGLALPRYAGEDETGRERVLRQQRLALLDVELKGPARNILVASSGDAKALYANGGLFTRALIDAIKSRKADVNNDGIIQFTELDLYVSNFVKTRSREMGVEQSPAPFRIGGNVVLILPPAP